VSPRRESNTNSWLVTPPAATAAPAATTTPTVAASASAITTSTTAVASRTGLVDYDIPAHKVLAVKGLDCAAGFFIVVDFNKAEATRLSRELVSHQADIRNRGARLLKPIPQFFFAGLKWEIADI
jgi:hypothetical protein